MFSSLLERLLKRTKPHTVMVQGCEVSTCARGLGGLGGLLAEQVLNQDSADFLVDCFPAQVSGLGGISFGCTFSDLIDCLRGFVEHAHPLFSLYLMAAAMACPRVA